jgi:hypothetical protein
VVKAIDLREQMRTGVLFGCTNFQVDCPTFSSALDTNSLDGRELDRDTATFGFTQALALLHVSSEEE